MEHDRERQEIERRLMRCRELLADYPDGPTAKNLREIERELLERLQSLQ